MKTWIRVKDGHNWLYEPMVGIVACLEKGKEDIWYNRSGDFWAGPATTIKDWECMGFIECSEEEAKALLKTNPIKPSNHRSFSFPKNSVLLEDVLKVIDDEPEYPGTMPDEVWETIKNNKEMMSEALKITVRLTKKGIKERIKGLTS